LIVYDGSADLGYIAKWQDLVNMPKPLMSGAVANCQRDLLPWPERAKAAGGVKEALPLGSLAPVIACEP